MRDELLEEELYWFREAKYRVLEGKRGVRRCYDEMAKRYEDSRYLYWTRRMEEGEERAIKGWLERLEPPILDVGCGTGRYTLSLVARDSTVVALDLSPGMIKRLREKAKGSEHLHPLIGDGEELPLRANSIKAILCALTFDHFEHPARAAQEFGRVLRPHGLCLLTTFNSQTLREFQRSIGLPKDRVPFRTEDMPPTLIHEVGHSAEEIRGIFQPEGFKVISIKGCCYWHLIPPAMERYNLRLDPLLNLIKRLLRYAEIHITLLERV